MDTLAVAQFGFASALATALLHSLWQCALLGILAALALAMMSRSSAAWRHAVAMAFLLAMPLLPLLKFIDYWRSPATQPGRWTLPIVSPADFDAVQGMFAQQSEPLAGVVALAWLLGVAFMLLRHAIGLRTLRAIETRPWQPLSEEWHVRVRSLQQRMRIARDVVVRLSSEVAVPFTARLLRPVIWLPLSLLACTPPEQLEALLAHELAHIARRDWLWNGLQCLAESLMFFHPAAWWLGRRIRQEREHACDDLAVVACGDAIVLAEALATLECQRRVPSPHLVLAAQGGSLMQRITRLLSASPARARWGARAALGLLALAGVALAVQISIAGGAMPDLRIMSTTDGKLGPGDSREITADGVDGKRFYRASVDAKGKLTEIYQVNGKTLPIDAKARAWIDKLSQYVPPPPPPVPPVPPPPPPPSPAPPPPPSLTDSPATKGLFELVVADPRVLAKTGTPARLMPGQPDGSVQTDDTRGHAELRLQLAGPKARATVDVEATRENGRWKIDALDAR